MNRREFLFFKKNYNHTAQLSCEELYMRYLESTLDGTTSLFFQNIEQRLSAVSFLHLADAAWLNCDELKPVQSILTAFRERGGRIEYQRPKP